MSWTFDNDKPIYIQLIDLIRFKIISGEFSIGEKLSSVRELAEEAGVNPNTMQKALVELEKQGLVYTQRTTGRFVTEDKNHIKAVRDEYATLKIKELTSALLKLGYEHEELLILLKENL